MLYRFPGVSQRMPYQFPGMGSGEWGVRIYFLEWVTDFHLKKLLFLYLMIKNTHYLIWCRSLIIIILILGVFFRFVNLDRKPYWHDEVFTSFWLAGYTSVEVEAKLANGAVISVADLQKYQHLDSQRGLVDTVKAIAAEDQQHPPLYYAIARLWVGWHGLNPLQVRLFSALISLLVFPALYWLCIELFNSAQVGWMAIILLAVSPFHILYAQEGRQYSFWTVTILLANTVLLRAMRLKTRLSWFTYAVGVSLLLYSHLLSFLLLISHSIYVGTMNRWRVGKDVRVYLLALSLGILTFAPWLVIIDKIKASSWTGETISLWTLVQRWIFNVNMVLFDPQVNYDDQLFRIRSAIDPVPMISLEHPGSFIVIPIFILVCYAIYFLIRDTSRQVWLFVIVLIGSTGLLLGLPDLIVGGQRSSIARFQIPCLLGIHLAVAYLLTIKVREELGTITTETGFIDKKSGLYYFKNKLWQISAIVIISLGILSCTIISQSETWWNKYTNYYDPQVAKIINQSPSVLLISNSTTRTTALSYLLNPQIKLLLVRGENPAPIDIPNNFSNLFLYQPSSEFLSQFEQNIKYKVEGEIEAGKLWRIIKR